MSEIENLLQSAASKKMGRIKPIAARGAGSPAVCRRSRVCWWTALGWWLGMAVAMATDAGAAWRWSGDRFAFANETVFDYGTGDDAGAEKVYTRRCLVMVRAALQFHRHARFNADGQRLKESDYRKRVREVVRRTPWGDAEVADRVEFPGFNDLHAFSSMHAGMIQEELGSGLATYWRMANWRIMLPFPVSGQAATAERLIQNLAAGRPQAVFLTRGTVRLNHAVLLYRHEKQRDGSIDFWGWDPNLPHRRMILRFADGRFSWPETFYFPGGRVNVYRIYTHRLD